jgi:hypothetical protein
MRQAMWSDGGALLSVSCQACGRQSGRLFLERFGGVLRPADTAEYVLFSASGVCRRMSVGPHKESDAPRSRSAVSAITMTSVRANSPPPTQSGTGSGEGEASSERLAM